MTVYAAIADSDVDPESPGTTTLFTRLRDNPLAIQEGDATAPSIQNAALAGLPWAASNYGTGSVGQAAIGASAIGQSEIKSGVNGVSTTGAQLLTLPGGTYGLYPQVKASDSSSAYGGYVGGNGGALIGTTYATRIFLDASSGGTMYAQHRYFTASGPYDLGDGEIPLFVFAEMNKATSEIISVYYAPEAPWHYNGPTDIRGKLGADGKKYRERKDLSSLPFTYASAKADLGRLREYHAAFNEAPVILEEITQEIKNADIPLIPRPMEPSASTEVIMLNPMSPLMLEFAEMTQHDQFSLNELLHEGRFAISNSAMTLQSPPGVGVHDFTWK